MEKAKLAFNKSFLSQFKEGDFLTVSSHRGGYAITCMYRGVDNPRYDQFTNTWSCILHCSLYAYLDDFNHYAYNPNHSFSIDDENWAIRFATKKEISFMYEAIMNSNYGEIYKRITNLEKFVRDNKEG